MCLCARPCFPIGFWNADVSKTIGHVPRIHSYTDCCQTHVCCKCWLHRLMAQFAWFWYLWPKKAFKMYQEFPAISLDWIYTLERWQFFKMKFIYWFRVCFLFFNKTRDESEVCEVGVGWRGVSISQLQSFHLDYQQRILTVLLLVCCF